MEKVCPRCKLPQEGIDECEYCGLVFAEYTKEAKKKPEREDTAEKKSNRKNLIISVITVIGFIGFLYVWYIPQSSKRSAEKTGISSETLNKQKKEREQRAKRQKEQQLKAKREQEKAAREQKRVAKKPASLTTYDMGTTINIGYTSYYVSKAWWSNKLTDNKYINKKPDATWLFIQLIVRNEDKKPRTIPPFKLIDSKGAEYTDSNKAWRVKGNIGAIETLNPGVKKKGVIIFDVPRNRSYKLKIRGGYWSAEKALINIATTN